MKKIPKLIGLASISMTLIVLLGAQTVQALKDAALPYGLTIQDTMAAVEQQLGQPRIIHAPQAGWEPGLPDDGGSPDHLHYWAIYRRFGLVVIYNSPSPRDKAATIHAIFLESRD